jgi:hypothetical protein
MKPITIKAMVAGVQAGRISAFVFIFSRSFRWEQPCHGCFDRHGNGKMAIQDGFRENPTRA